MKSDFDPQAIARATAKEMNKTFNLYAWEGCEEECAKLILSAAAQIVREAGVVGALQLASLNYKRINHCNPDMMMDDEHEAWSACDAALQNARSLMDSQPKSP